MTAEERATRAIAITSDRRPIVQRIAGEIEEAVLEERERCAKIANDLKKNAWDNMQLDDIDEHDKAAGEAIWAAAGYIHMAITKEVVAMETVEMIAEIIRKGGTF